jgi:hypothetical protein
MQVGAVRIVDGEVVEPEVGSRWMVQGSGGSRPPGPCASAVTVSVKLASWTVDGGITHHHAKANVSWVIATF